MSAKGKPLSVPNTTGGSATNQPTKAQQRAILAAFFGKGPNHKGEFMALHPFWEQLNKEAEATQ